MRQLREISASTLTRWLVAWLIATNLLIMLAHSTGWWFWKIPLFLCVTLLPGFALLRSLRITFQTFFVAILYSFGLSILVLMISGLITNQVFFIAGIDNPLELQRIIIVWGVLTLGLIGLSIFTNPQAMQLRIPSFKKLPKPVVLLLCATLLLPGLVVFGAFRLNNGGDGIVALVALIYAAVLLIAMLLLHRRIPHNIAALLIFVFALSILLMTSLRGWDVLGHDIEREFRVYTLTHMHSHWDMRLDQDPYNACLSITILPEMFAKILNMSGLMVFKVILQIIFAVCTVAVYGLLRRYASKLGALAGTILFICYPTFINDSAMLTRQGVAYLFFSLAIFIATNHTQRIRFKLLFLLCALGLVVSHYSTAYMFVALCVIAVAIKWYTTLWSKKRHPIHATVFSPLFAVIVVLMTYTWYAQLTATSGGLAITLQKSILNIPHLFTEDNRSSDTSTALLFAGGKTQVDLYETYLTNSQNKETAVDASHFMPQLTSDNLPLTSAGTALQKLGIDPGYVSVIRQNFAKILQGLAIAGVLFAAYRWWRDKPGAPNLDLVCLNLAGLAVLTLMVILPVLSINYGVLRAFQQELIFLVIPIVLLFTHATHRLKSRFNTMTVTGSIAFIFLLFTGVLAQLLGGSSPSLSMNNSGLYFGLYSSSQADVRSFAWLKEHVPSQRDVRAANFNRAIMHDPDYPFNKTGILPLQLQPYSYVYLDYAQVRTQKFYTYYESSPLTMTFPLEYYDLAKDQIYSTTSTRIYR